MRRRQFLHGCGHGLAALLAALSTPRPGYASARFGREVACDVAVIGGGLGGVAAALAALRVGKTVVLTEATDWVGGQLTSQAVPPDEHPWIESFGANRSYRQIRADIRQYYRDHYPLSAAARRDPTLNPGGGSVSKLCAEPKVALAALTARLAPYAASGQLLVLLEHEPIAAEVDADRVRSVRVRDRLGDGERTVIAPFFLDATELGDLLPLAGVEFRTGSEPRSLTDEPHAPAEARPDNHQAFTCCFVVDYVDGADHTIDKPAEYAFWRDYVPQLSPPWPGKLLAWEFSDPRTLESRHRGFDPREPGRDMWKYRQIVSKAIYEDPARHTSASLINWPQNDYWLGNLFGGPPGEAERHLTRAKQLSLSLLYWMQTEAPRPDRGQGWRGLRLRPDLVGTRDGLAKAPYVRESRRIQAEFLVTEEHVGLDARKAKLRSDDPEQPAAPFSDTVGVGAYRIDLHPTSGGDNYVDISSCPFQVPLGALLPVRVENLFPACKNLGVTHITNGCYRLHPVEWAIGEAAGALAAWCHAQGQAPRAVRNDPVRLAAFQAELVAQGVEIAWPRTSPR